MPLERMYLLSTSNHFLTNLELVMINKSGCPLPSICSYAKKKKKGKLVCKGSWHFNSFDYFLFYKVNLDIKLNKNTILNA